MKQEGIEELFEIINEVLQGPYYYSEDRFAARCLGELIEFFHSQDEHQSIIDLTQKFTYKQLLSAKVIFEVAYAYVSIGNNKQGRSYYRAYLRDVDKSAAVANNLALLEEEAGNLQEAERLLVQALEWNPSEDKAPNNLAQVRRKIQEAENQKRALQKAADLYLQETEEVRRIIAELYSQRTSDELILCNSKKLASLLNQKPEQIGRKLSEFVQKKYFEEVSDQSMMAFDGRILRTNPVLVPYLQKELEVMQEKNLLKEITANLSADNLSKKYGYDRQLIDYLAFMHSKELARMLERDLHEAVVALVIQSYKSALTLCGGIAEAILLDQLLVQQNAAIQALESVLARKGGKIRNEDRQIDHWGLERLLDVALEMQIISNNLYHWGHGIRGFRNLVHPGVEHRKTTEVSRENAEMAWTVVKRLLKEISEASNKTP